MKSFFFCVFRLYRFFSSFPLGLLVRRSTDRRRNADAVLGADGVGVHGGQNRSVLSNYIFF